MLSALISSRKHITIGVEMVNPVGIMTHSILWKSLCSAIPSKWALSPIHDLNTNIN